MYFKQSDLIADFLTLLGAPISAMGIIEAKLEKELKNKVNRRCNCDDANTSKVVDAAQEQLAAIRRLSEAGQLESLPDKLLQAAKARQENPDRAGGSDESAHYQILHEPPFAALGGAGAAEGGNVNGFCSFARSYRV